MLAAPQKPLPIEGLEFKDDDREEEAERSSDSVRVLDNPYMRDFLLNVYGVNAG